MTYIMVIAVAIEKQRLILVLIKLSLTMRVARREQRHGYRYRRFPGRTQRKGCSRSKGPVILQTVNCTRVKDKEVPLLKTKLERDPGQNSASSRSLPNIKAERQKRTLSFLDKSK